MSFSQKNFTIFNVIDWYPHMQWLPMLQNGAWPPPLDDKAMGQFFHNHHDHTTKFLCLLVYSMYWWMRSLILFWLLSMTNIFICFFFVYSGVNLNNYDAIFIFILFLHPLLIISVFLLSFSFYQRIFFFFSSFLNFRFLFSSAI